MRLRTALASLAVAIGLAGSSHAAAVPSWSAPPAAPPVHRVVWDGLFSDFECSGCVDVKLAPAPIGYRRATRLRVRHHRGRHGRVLRVRG